MESKIIFVVDLATLEVEDVFIVNSETESKEKYFNDYFD